MRRRVGVRLSKPIAYLFEGETITENRRRRPLSTHRRGTKLAIYICVSHPPAISVAREAPVTFVENTKACDKSHSPVCLYQCFVVVYFF